MELANIFGWDIDFVFDIRAGDSFALLFEERFIDGQRLPAGTYWLLHLLTVAKPIKLSATQIVEAAVATIRPMAKHAQRFFANTIRYFPH